MKIQAFRIIKARHADQAFTGEGARLFGGRWNTPGTPLIYTASTISLAMLEILVHGQSRDLLHTYQIFIISFDEKLIEVLDIKDLFDDWQTSPPPPDTQSLGDQWYIARTSAVLRVPSVIVPSESNYLLNPDHPKFKQIQISDPEPITFDLRFRK